MILLWLIFASVPLLLRIGRTLLCRNKIFAPLLLIFISSLINCSLVFQMSAGDIMLASSTDFLISLRADILNETPRLKALKEKVFANPGIAKYVKDRPKTDV